MTSDATPPLRAGLYARKSKQRRRTSGQANELGRSVVEQIDEERAWCAANNCVVVAEYIDDDRSASRFTDQEREEFERLLADIAAKKLDIVVAWESARYQRDLAIYTRIRDACRLAGVLYCYGGRIYDMRDRTDRRNTAFDAIKDEDAAEETSERVKRALRANARNGRPHGSRQAYGYRREYDKVSGKLSAVVIDEQPRVALSMACVAPDALVVVEWFTRPQIVREIADWIITGHSIYWIIGELNGRGIPPMRKGLWTHSTIRHLMLTPSIMGKRAHNKEIIGDAIWPGIISEETWLTVGEILARPERKTIRDGAVKHLLTTIASCDICGQPAATGKSPRGYRGYKCSQNKHFFVQMDRIDAYIELLLVERFSREDAVELFAVQRDPSLTAKDQADVARWEEELRDGERLVEAGEMTMRLLASIEQRLQPLIDAANARIKAHRLNPLLAKLINPDPEEVWAEWEALEVAQKRSVIRDTFEYIRIRPPGAGRRPPPEEIVSHRWRTAE